MDAALRELSRRAAAGDAEARAQLVPALLRAQVADPGVWAGVGYLPHAELFARAAELPAALSEALTGDLLALDAARLRAHFPRDAQGRPRAEAVLHGYPQEPGRWSDPRDLIAQWSDAGPLCVGLSAARGRPVPRWSWDRRVGPAVTRVALGPDERLLLTTADGEVLEETRGQRRLLGRGAAPVLALAAAGDGAVWITPEALHAAGADPRPLPVRATTAALDPRAARVAVSDGRALVLMDVPSGVVAWRVEDAGYPQRSEVRGLVDLAFSPWGEHLAQACGAVIPRETRRGAALGGPPVLPGRSTSTWSDNSSTMGLGRDEGQNESWPDARQVRWLSANRLVTLGGDLRVWTLGSHARPGPSQTHYGEDTTSRTQWHQRSDADARADALLDVSSAGVLVLTGSVPRLLDAGLLERWRAEPEGEVVCGACSAERVVLGRADGGVEVHYLIEG